MKKQLKNTILGQDNAIDLICDSFRKNKCVKNSSKPLSFLFLGPTGVGKTFLAKEYGKYFYGDNIIKVDMSEYKEGHSISKMIGSPPGYIGYGDNKNVFEMIKDNPYSLIILDDIEKASKEVINLFLQILDEGVATNSKGEKINFSNTTIIMTSNLGFNRNSIGFEGGYTKKDINKFFGVEFVNRIGSVIRFNTIDDDISSRIIRKRLNGLRKKYKGKGMNCSFSNNLISEIIDICECNKYGARKINDVISGVVEDEIINNIINGITKIRVSSIKDLKVV